MGSHTMAALSHGWRCQVLLYLTFYLIVGVMSDAHTSEEERQRARAARNRPPPAPERALVTRPPRPIRTPRPAPPPPPPRREIERPQMQERRRNQPPPPRMSMMHKDVPSAEEPENNGNEVIPPKMSDDGGEGGYGKMKSEYTNEQYAKIAQKTYGGNYKEEKYYKPYYTTPAPWYTPVKYQKPKERENAVPNPMPQPMEQFNKKLYFKEYTTKDVPTEAFYEPTFKPVPDVTPLPTYKAPYRNTYITPDIPYRTMTTKKYPNVYYKHTFPRYTTTTTTTYTTTTYTTTTTTWYKPIKYHRPKLHENIAPAPMPKPIDKYYKFYEQKPFTSTTFKYEDYVEKEYTTPATVGSLPELTTMYYEAKHDSKIPYREVTEKVYENLQKYEHTFPKYTKYYKPYESYTEKYKAYKPEPYTEKPEEPYKPEEPDQNVYPADNQDGSSTKEGSDEASSAI